MYCFKMGSIKDKNSCAHMPPIYTKTNKKTKSIHFHCICAVLH